VIVGTPATKAVAGVTYEFVPDAADADDDVLTFAIENRPDWPRSARPPGACRDVRLIPPLLASMPTS
jgi:hypothetical protein